jgi:hypothetical protein
VFEVLISKVLPNRDRKGVGMGLRLTKGDEDACVAHALLRAAFTLCERLGSVARVFARVRTRHA